MDDNEYVCPLCCEELDLSDREFYPCKCGYQVCMWCWHRIRETESGLCPACRTPYGEDPHQFSAVDVEEVLKANKEKEAAAKRQRQQQLQEETIESIDIPKDRSQLANMRVIRRNLVYAVGLPPSIASEENLRKPEFFGQYGKISKIVLNRSQANIPDARRASASAYVTFVYKEDTLACILALDGFYLENRNIRASYGTSKYCSAFIKSVRCNNPECTYLHEMGAAEDTFTKQEIQAGYVTSGRDVLARQQQIVAEQLRLAGSSIGAPRKRTGNGGPSGTGKAALTPVFPPPEFDEPAKPATALVPPLPPPQVAIPRAVSSPMTGTSSAAMTTTATTAMTTTTTATTTTTQHVRSTSVGSKSPTLSSVVAPAMAKPPPVMAPLLSAASVVAGGRPATKLETPEPHTTLTPLAPLKRNKATSKSVGELDKLRTTGIKKKNGITLPASDNLSVTSDMVIPMAPISGPGSIGGEIIGPPLPTRITGIASLGGEPVGPSGLGGLPLESPLPAPGSFLGGEVFHGPLENRATTMAIGSGKDKWNMGPHITGTPGMWGHPGSMNATMPTPIGGQQLGGGSSTSTLASILGINLPTGSGSLRDSNNLWDGTPPPISAPSPLASLNGSSMLMGGGESLVNGSSLIGGVPIGARSLASTNNRMNAAPGSVIGSGVSGGVAAGPVGGKSDIALLQSLLPGVHITSGNDAYGFGWNTTTGPGGLNGDAISHWNAGGGGSNSSASVGTIGRNNQGNRGQGIW